MELRPCQKDALIAFEKYYYEDEENDRGIISMCCGSGKTFTAYNVIKKCILEYKEKFFIIANSKIDLIKKSNEKFGADKYLFMTATPVKLLLKNENAPFQNDETTYSMDNENIYGKIVYEYTFYQGFTDNPPVLVPFKPIYLIQDDEI